MFVQHENTRMMSLRMRMQKKQRRAVECKIDQHGKQRSRCDTMETSLALHVSFSSFLCETVMIHGGGDEDPRSA